MGITYGIFNKKQIGNSNTTNVSLGENLRYSRNMSRNPAPTTTAHSRLKEYKWSSVNSAAMITIKFMGIKEHINATINTTVSLSILSIYPILELMSSKDTSARKNFKSGVIYTSYLLYRVINICFATSKVVIINPFTFRTSSHIAHLFIHIG